MARVTSSWLRGFDPPPGQDGPTDGAPQLFCFPHAGGAASALRSLAQTLTGTFDVLVAQYPGRQDRRLEAPFDDIGRLADALAVEVSRRAEGPYALFGHSMGALLAYEVARRLAEDRGPAALVLSARGAPTPEPGRHDRLRTDDEIVRAVSRLGGTMPEVLHDPELREMVMPALRADYRALSSYTWRPGPPLTVPFTLLVGAGDPVVDVEQVERWAEFTTAGARTHVLAGGHFYLDAHLDFVSEVITDAWLAASASGVGPARG
ncbi:thioesterase II family protein [Streptomyces sp. NPDC058579]|uniref:thioesterase II family protein n=1 Tax=Streptomyces sp. NPDC058579 TaxID=3346548 RepID=UPI00364A2B3B